MRGKLNLRQEAFCREYLRRRNASRAYVAAGYAPRGANANAARLIANDSIRSRIGALSADLCRGIDIATDAIAERYALIAFADVTELMGHRYTACRYCHGRGHYYHWRTAREFQKALAHWTALPEKQQSLVEQPRYTGGKGFSADLDPHPQCPMCDGLGIFRVVQHDTRYLSPGARALFAGVKETSYGSQIKVHDRMHALDRLANILGVFEKDKRRSCSGDLLGQYLLNRISTKGSPPVLNWGDQGN